MSNKTDENIYKTIVENLGVEIFVTDGEGNVLFVNPASIAINELEVDNLVGRNVSELIDEGYFGESSTLRVLEEKNTVSLLQNLKHNKQVVATGVPIFDEDGNIKMVITTSFISQGFIDDFRYTEDLSDSYTVVKVVQETDDKDKPKEYIVKDDNRVKQYGRIQYYEKLNKDEDGDKKAETIYNDNVNLKTTFSVSGVQGDIRARGGTPIYVDFHNQDRAEYIRGWYRIDSATHHFIDNLHTMDLDLTLIGSMDANGWTLGEKWIKEA